VAGKLSLQCLLVGLLTPIHCLKKKNPHTFLSYEYSLINFKSEVSQPSDITRRVFLVKWFPY
jgi:hypothetical protein